MFGFFSTKYKHRKRHPVDDDITASELQHLTHMQMPHSEPLNKSRITFTKGWRFGALNCAIAASIVFLTNLIATIAWATNTDSGELFRGDCDRARKINAVLHVIINLLSTILLSSSNYVMQCLSAPTRTEIDVAHSRGQWMDIGVLSVRNLRRISKKRVLLWSALALSSLPLHLFYNSVVYLSLAAYSYEVYGVRQNFVDSPECLGCTNPIKGADFAFTREIHQKIQEDRFQRLDNIDCIDAYATTLQTHRGDLLVVAKSDDIVWGNQIDNYRTDDDYLNNENSAVFWTYSLTSGWEYVPQDTFQWICSNHPDADPSSRNPKSCDAVVDEIRNSAQNWTISSMTEHSPSAFGFHYMRGPIQYCLRERKESECRVLWSIPIASLVTALNFIKAILIFHAALRIREQPLMTMGDAVVSFLKQPDPWTRNMCLASSKNIESARDNFIAGPKRWTRRTYRWKDATSLTRRISTFTVLLISIATIGGFLSYGLRYLRSGKSHSLSNLAALGFGAIDARTLIEYPREHNVDSIIGNTLIANVPQVVLSIIYFSCNSLLTCMLLGKEWSSYSYVRKGLRVSSAPRGLQRSTYFLSLPYRFAIPLMAISGLLHWMISQSIFFAAIEFYGIGDSVPSDVRYTCGYSPIAMISVIIVASLVLIVGVGVGFVPLRPGTNLVGSCSAAMSAACHLSTADKERGDEIAVKKLMWGVVEVQSNGAGHCSFSDEAVENPKEGELYAGPRAQAYPQRPKR